MKQPWYLDSGFSRHMTDGKSLFQELDRNKSGNNVSFGDNSKGVIRGIGTIGNNSYTQIKNVFLVILKYNLLSISQFRDKGYRVSFGAHACHVINSNTNQIIYIGKRYENVYVIYIDETVKL